MENEESENIPFWNGLYVSIVEIENEKKSREQIAKQAKIWRMNHPEPEPSQPEPEQIDERPVYIPDKLQAEPHPPLN